MGLVLNFKGNPSPRSVLTLQHVADNCFPSRMNVYDFDDLLAAALKLRQRFGLERKCPQQLNRRIACAFELRNLICFGSSRQ